MPLVMSYGSWMLAEPRMDIWMEESSVIITTVTYSTRTSSQVLSRAVRPMMMTPATSATRNMTGTDSVAI